MDQLGHYGSTRTCASLITAASLHWPMKMKGPEGGQDTSLLLNPPLFWVGSTILPVFIIILFHAPLPVPSHPTPLAGLCSPPVQASGIGRAWAAFLHPHLEMPTTESRYGIMQVLQIQQCRFFHFPHPPLLGNRRVKANVVLFPRKARTRWREAARYWIYRIYRKQFVIGFIAARYWIYPKTHMAIPTLMPSFTMCCWAVLFSFSSDKITYRAPKVYKHHFQCFKPGNAKKNFSWEVRWLHLKANAL